ncbi:hypothetical protein [Siphonobacter sp. SORGH_AS_0500]|uniref:hypothetical protein n=1 Tax=Siphonobacter sp. SORGH_AS_0500 TaxID=1864824 RepID=UPI00285CBB0F|nr:hypothetical protein [Siphonobacter sp. SORGH_AS_0500]MDR6196145.1 hypothetical protein [Siphonobacter sp. SORGH_AS_0500]
MQALFIEGREILIASSLNELSARQLRQFVVWQDHSSREDNLWQLLFILMGTQSIWFRWWLFVQYRLKPFLGAIGFNLTVRQLNEEQIEDILEIPLQLLRSEARLARQKQPTIWVRLWGILPMPLHGPTELLTSCTYRQYRRAEVALARLNPNPFHRRNFCSFVATLYTRPRWASFASEKAIEKALFHISYTRLEAVRLFYLGSRHYMIQQHKELFPSRGNQPTQKNPTPAEITEDYATIRRNLAIQIVNEETVDEKALWDVMGWANYEARKHREEKEYWEKQKQKK